MRVSGRAGARANVDVAGLTVSLAAGWRKNPVFSVELSGTPKSGHQQSALGCACEARDAKSLLRLTASLFALGPELLTLLTM